jgi:hypothetical protein
MAGPLARAGLSRRFTERALRRAAVPRASHAADSRGLNQAQPSGGQHAASRASGTARQPPQMTISHPGMTAVSHGMILRTLTIG